MKWRSVKKAAKRRGVDVGGLLGFILSHSVAYAVTSGIWATPPRQAR